MVMACQYQDVPDDTNQPINMGSVGYPNPNGIHANTKGEMVEHGVWTDIKVEYSTVGDCDGVYQKQDMINAGILCNIAEPIKSEPGAFSSNTQTFQPAVIKIEDDEFSGSIFKYKKEEQYVTWEEGTNTGRSIENNLITDDVAGPSSSYELKHEEVDLGLVKVDEDEDTTSESTEAKDRESGEQYSAHNIHSLKHMKTRGEKFETFECLKCQKKCLSKYGLDDHIVTLHSSNAELMKSVTHAIYQCKYCTYVTIITKCLNRHMKTHGEKIPSSVDCIKCNKEFSSKYCLDGHIVSRHSNDAEMMERITSRILRCKQCTYMTVHAHSITLHMMTHGEKPEKTFDCIKCSDQFPAKYCLDDHIVRRHSDNDEIMNTVTSKVHPCKYCKYITIFTNRLTQHMRKHGKNPEATFDCIKCEKKFLSKLSLDDHIVTVHSNNAEIMKSVTNTIHRCKHCIYMTVIKDRFNRHMNIHGAKLGRKFNCIKCEHVSPSKFSLDNHIVTRHRDNGEMMNSVTRKTYSCNHCNYITVYVSKLTKHMGKHGKISKRRQIK